MMNKLNQSISIYTMIYMRNIEIFEWPANYYWIIVFEQLRLLNDRLAPPRKQ